MSCARRPLSLGLAPTTLARLIVERGLEAIAGD